jgi:predicted RNA-binding protein with PIN domain
MRRLIVDGMNVIGSRPDRWWRDPDAAVRTFVDDVGRFASTSKDDVTVVFDRRPTGMRAGRHGPIRVAFARGKGRNAADHDIVRMVEEDADAGSIVVVTSDRELAERVRELGAAVEPAGRFRARLDRALKEAERSPIY